MNQLQKAELTDTSKILSFLNSNPDKNTFQIANIQNYGLEFPSLHVYYQEENGDIVLVYLVFFTNILFSGNAKYLQRDDFEHIVKEHHVTLALGFSEFINKLTLDHKPGDKFLKYTNQVKKPLNINDNLKIKEAGLSDVDDIYEFLQSLEETKNLYKDKAIIRERIIKGDGTHFIISDEKGIIAHANTSANSDKSIMIGGVGVRLDKRRLGYGSYLVSFIVNQYYSHNKSVCSIASEQAYNDFYKQLGFDVLGDWKFYNIGGI